MKAKYRCCNCKLKFEKEEPGYANCPVCDHVYVEWLNYSEFEKKIMERELWQNQSKNTSTIPSQFPEAEKEDRKDGNDRATEFSEEPTGL
jgi:uncharacterized Zn finger protein (UPF0148 family)